MLVLNDVRLDKISAAHAEAAYGVVVRAGEVDLEATRRVRAERRHSRAVLAPADNRLKESRS